MEIEKRIQDQNLTNETDHCSANIIFPKEQATDLCNKLNNSQGTNAYVMVSIITS